QLRYSARFIMGAPSSSDRQVRRDAQMPATDFDEERVAFGCPDGGEMAGRPDGDASKPEPQTKADRACERAVHDGDGARRAAKQNRFGQRPVNRNRKSEQFVSARHQTSAPPP